MNLQQLGRAVAPFRRDDAELGHVPADRIRQHRALTHQKLPTAMQHQARLLLLGLRRHKPHRGPRHRLADRRCAKIDCDKAIDLDPKYAEAYISRCWIYGLKEDYDRAMADCDKGIDLDPKIAESVHQSQLDLQH